MLDEVDYVRDLEQFCGPDEAAARTALDRLAVAARRFIRALFADSLSPDDLEELIQTALLKVWGSRLSFVNRGRAAWYGWIKRIAHNARIDLFRQRGDEAGGPVPEDKEDDQLPLIERFMTEIAGQELFRLADTVWLELDGSCPEEHRDRCLLAVQLVYFDGWSLDDALSLLSGARPGAPPLTRAQLNAWLEIASNLRWVGYHELLYSPERLAAHLLGLPPHAGSRELEAMLAAARRAACADGEHRDWTPREVEAILWRYYRGLSIEETAQQIKNCPPAEIAEIFVRCALLFPFHDQCTSVCAWLDQVEVTGRGPIALIGSRSGLWRRLAFEYRYRFSLPVRDIHARVRPAAQAVRYDISFDVLNTWISGGRLLDKLRLSYEAKEAGGPLG